MDIGFGTISMGALAEIVVRNGAGKRLSRRIETYFYKPTDKFGSL